MKRNVIIALAAVIFIAAAIVTQIVSSERSSTGRQANDGDADSGLPLQVAVAKTGYPAPEFTLKTLDDQEYRFVRSDMDKPVLLNFWASWCGPCASEAPALKDLHERYGDRVEFLAINVTGAEFFGIDKVTEFVEKYEWQMPVLLDEKGEVSQEYKVYAFPITVLIDRNGVVNHVIHGEFDPEDLEKRLAKL
jgi:thiol-disulfide isomerase/thioredoxin